jgi:hypothetical protein
MPLAEKSLPKPVQEAVDQMIATLSREDKGLIRTVDETDLGQFHFGSGTGIREVFKLWDGSKDLLKSCGSESMHPDDAAMVIIEALWRRLQTKH